MKFDKKTYLKCYLNFVFLLSSSIVATMTMLFYNIAYMLFLALFLHTSIPKPIKFFRPIPALIGFLITLFIYEKYSSYEPKSLEISGDNLIVKSLFSSRIIPFSKIKFVKKSNRKHHYTMQSYYRQSYFITYTNYKNKEQNIRVVWHAYNGDFKAFEDEMIRAIECS
ncbi:MAG: hypothetical protein N4A40_04035 [Tissierellales bacterium]|jgi:hypothetical protein|nr:hypothetical protein [Tissierellales bacterium]